MIIVPWTYHVFFLYKLFFKQLYCLLNVSLLQFTIKFWVTCLSKFHVFVSWIWKICFTNVPPTSLERPIIWSWGRPATGFCRSPVDVPVWNFWMFFLPVKNWNRYVIQGHILLKTIFSLNPQFLYWSSENPLKLPCRSQNLEPLGDLQWTSPGRRVDVGYMQQWILLIENDKYSHYIIKKLEKIRTNIKN